ncbi:hypothetical protein Poli38472_011864 [Pythium oligandrum]|uniref:RING-type domain-containing protein n=1 Tax=Pythium oligandrum TaxID=41045 RepID=A0A8K1FDF3_PYTOL|nr:hypothetical protein Poli38472_011864 [Pythium oligandrum]|eukprot:TMW58276.1 hypothetical protein Poli38472_011864 [Pythium oligandrum]
MNNSSSSLASSPLSSASTSSRSRFPRRLRVVTEPKQSNKMHSTRSLSELILLSPRSSPRITPRNKRFDMDIEVPRTFAEGEGTIDIFAHTMRRRLGRHHSFFSDDNENETAPSARFSDVIVEENNQEDNDAVMEDVQELQAMASQDQDVPAPEEEPEPAAAPERSVGEVIDMLFEIHTALKTKHLGQRTAASALAASNLVSSLAYPAPEPIPRDEVLETLDNTRKMLECAICQEVFSGATEATCCGQIFCKDCIERWVSERGSCPMCRENISFSLLVSSRHAQRMANEMKVNCPHCSDSMKKALLADHITVCDMAPVEPPPPADVALRNLLVTTARLNASFMRRFALAPSPQQAMMMQCYIRTRGGGNYELYTQDNDTLILTAARRRQYDMSVTFQIYLANNIDNNSAAIQVARLEKNYMGSQYTMYDTTGEQPVELGAVQYAATFGKSPRQMRVALPLVQELPEVDSSVDGTPSWAIQQWQPQNKEDTILAQVENPDQTRSINLINKPPVWIESLEAYCLDFGGRVAAASVKNFLLSHPDDMDKTLMLFGRTQDRQVYSMDYAHPFSPVQAFAIALSSMDSHLVTFD